MDVHDFFLLRLSFSQRQGKSAWLFCFSTCRHSFGGRFKRQYSHEAKMFKVYFMFMCYASFLPKDRSGLQRVRDGVSG